MLPMTKELAVALFLSFLRLSQASYKPGTFGNRSEKDISCYLPEIRGQCRGFFPRYSYNYKTGKCRLFLYGGCGGNSNKFKTLKQCQMSCAVKFQRKTIDIEKEYRGQSLSENLMKLKGYPKGQSAFQTTKESVQSNRVGSYHSYITEILKMWNFTRKLVPYCGFPYGVGYY